MIDAAVVIRELTAALHGWLAANAPGGWIDDLRQRAAPSARGNPQETLTARIETLIESAERAGGRRANGNV